MDILSLCFVKQIYADKRFRTYFHYLQGKVKTAFKASRVADYDSRVGFSKTDKVPRNLFLDGVRKQ